MTLLRNVPEDFATEAVDGFARAWPDHLVRVHGGVVRADASPVGEVSVVLGGGSGHYPAFAGWVGEGLAHGATCGNVFASPSASQVYSVVRAADNGGGVLLGFGNYAGDVLHFGQAAERLRAEGIDVRTVAVTDDVASAPANRSSERRGIAGDLVVFKIAGAAAGAGWDLDEVERVTRKANARTRSLGLAFSGCTLPGADAPLFTVPADTMAVGLGIHGEPGIDQTELRAASDVADRLVDGVLLEEPGRDDGYRGRVAVLLNGLGCTKYEELFVVHKRVAERLEAAGLSAVAPLVGEQVTSLDMAGLSLTLMFLDDELERLWLEPASTPSFHRARRVDRPRRHIPAYEDGDQQIASGGPASRISAGAVVKALRAVAVAIREHERELGELDTIAGDGDHGRGMLLGAEAARRAAEDVTARGAGVRTTLIAAGTAWSDRAGGTSGALWGAALTAAGAALSDQDGADPSDVVDAVASAAEAILRLGGAQEGDKTMVDALLPFSDTLQRRKGSGAPILSAWRDAAIAASRAAEATSSLSARLGRARTHGDRSIGYPDAGATSFALVVEAAAAPYVGSDRVGEA